MSIGLLFWIIMVVWFIFGAYQNRGAVQGGNFSAFSGSMILFVLLFLLGWRVFGFVIHQ
jgi:hypothetical protein